MKNSAGTTTSSTANVLVANIYREYETNTDPAFARYSADFRRSGTTPLAITIELMVQRNTYWLEK